MLELIGCGVAVAFAVWMDYREQGRTRRARHGYNPR